MTDAGSHRAEVADAWAELGYDPDLLREKYRQERDKRIRPEGVRQYRRVTGELSHYLADPYTPRLERPSVHDYVEVAIIGGGWAGLLLGGRLRAAGVENLRIIEQAGDFGGTWYWNRYPGAACDTEAYIYLPLLEETGYVPTEKYAKAPEILEHARRIARHFDLYRDALLQTAVTEVRWSDEESEWTISTDRGDTVRAKFVCMTTGAFVKPKLPGVAGIEKFKGHSFHTTRWDYDYTGGDGSGGLTGLTDKRVGIIGTGATAIGCIPIVAQSAKHLYVFQRTPAAVGERNNRPTDSEWARTLEPGWQRRRMENFDSYLVGGDAEEDLVKDGWTEIIRIYRSFNLDGDEADSEAAIERADFARMEQIRARVDLVVKDKEVAEALKPYYRALCKRPCFHDEYLETFNRPNVTLVDTNGRGIDAVSERGIVANGVDYDLDCIIFASGFQVGGSLRSRVGYEVFGRRGQALSDRWREGISTLFGMQTRGFPNFFIVSLFQVGISSNQTHPLDVQSRHIAYLIEQARSRNAETLEVTEEAEQWWVNRVIEASNADIEFLESCTPSYLNNEGQPNLPLVRRNGRYAPGIIAFARELEEWRADGRLWGEEFAIPNWGPQAEVDRNDFEHGVLKR